jgi:mRNA interferase MazF
MEKDFDEWNTLKKTLHHEQAHERCFHDREIWWCSLGINVGNEQDGRNDHFVRPVLILRRYNSEVALVVPLTRTQKEGRFYHVLAVASVRGSRVVLSQLRTISSKRLRARMARVPEKEFCRIRDKIVQLNFEGPKRKNPSEEGL